LFHAIPLDYKSSLARAIVPVLAVAAASYYLIEKPGIRLGRRLTGYGSNVNTNLAHVALK
jgi:peptidoglycan/LPS O-acetylase OafA/YrhL